MRYRVTAWLPWIASAAVAGYLIYLGRAVLVPFLLAFLLAYLFDPLVDWFEARRVPRSLGIVILVLGLVGALALLVLGIVPEAQRQVEHFSERVPAYREAIQSRLAPLMAWIEERFPDYRGDLRERGIQLAQEHLPRLLTPVLGFLRRTSSSVVNLILGTLNLVVIPVLGFYLLKDIDRIKAAAAGYLPVRWRDRTVGLLREIDATLRRFLRGQLTVAGILAVLYSVGLTLLGVPLAILLGVVAGLANVVPYLGIAIGLLPALGLSFLDAGDPWRLLGVVAVFSGAQMLEGMVITPRIVGQEVGLHPVVVLLAVIVGGQAFGFLGILLAVPFTAAAAVLFRRLRGAYLDSAFYRGRPSRRRRHTPRRLKNRAGY